MRIRLRVRLLLSDFLLFLSFIPHKHFGIQLQNFLLAIDAPSRRDFQSTKFLVSSFWFLVHRGEEKGTQTFLHLRIG